MVAKQTWYPITASSRKSTIALNSGDAELVAARSGACEGMGLRQQWNWLLQFGCNAEETNETTQQILCCDSFAALIDLKNETYRVESVPLARPEVRLCSSGNEGNACGL